ncbi:hypothetical protein B5X24_HaOG215984 [Helicoverpa armigera]|nr:hypothetical protein B5X24_HaOG215984 [Helicoverpa armigera]
MQSCVYYPNIQTQPDALLKKTASKRSNENIILCSLSLPDTDRIIYAQSAPAFTDWKRDASGVREIDLDRRSILPE